MRAACIFFRAVLICTAIWGAGDEYKEARERHAG
jgi:hypothetical protein